MPPSSTTADHVRRNRLDGFVRVRGAREHNLKNIDIEIPRDALVVFTGVSGSGKSSLAFGTLYAEAQRRYPESVAPYARRLFHQNESRDERGQKPRVVRYADDVVFLFHPGGAFGMHESEVSDMKERLAHLAAKPRVGAQ
jgi:ABC-type glutathione transport system ATPase component